ncbi:expressed unknown protein (Partial), partial [Seminavis robusta]
HSRTSKSDHGSESKCSSDDGRRKQCKSEREAEDEIGDSGHDVQQVAFNATDNGFFHHHDPSMYFDPNRRGGPTPQDPRFMWHQHPYPPTGKLSDGRVMPSSHHEPGGNPRYPDYRCPPYPSHPVVGHPYDPYWHPYWAQQTGFHQQMDPRLRRGPSRGGTDGPSSVAHPGSGKDGSHSEAGGGDQREGSLQNPRSLRRRHSIGSAHSRDAIMHEVTVSIQQDQKTWLNRCSQCGQSVIDCRCSNLHHEDEAIQGNDDHGRPRDLESRLGSSSHQDVSLFDTFGIRNPNAQKRGMGSHSRIDGEFHASTHMHPGFYRPPPLQPLYRRPEGFDVIDYVHMSNTQRLAGSMSQNNHRGRTFQRFQEQQEQPQDEAVTAGPMKNASQLSSSEKSRAAMEARRVVVDDGSLRYPPMRSFSFGSKSGRRSTSGRFSVMSEGSIASFAV